MEDHPGLADGTAELKAAEVSAFCARELPQRAGSSARNLAAALRSFLRFLHVEGLLVAPLAQAVPPVAGSAGAGLPRAVAPATLAALLASCDRRTATGRRDYAIMVLLARLGLRAGEVARLSLDDIDWRSGELLVHGKGGRDERMPLPDDVGAALAGYVRRGRPRADTRVVFLRAIAPAVGLSGGGSPRSSMRDASVPKCRESGRTSFATAVQPRCSVQGLHWSKSARFSGTP